ncbi:MAG: hypothetical protein HQL31_14400, partial [Planctomycetes bacterium]|nr:hypothetical protein [Planctomycetota bacterium]
LPRAEPIEETGVFPIPDCGLPDSSGGCCERLERYGHVLGLAVLGGSEKPDSETRDRFARLCRLVNLLVFDYLALDNLDEITSEFSMVPSAD